MKIDVLASGSSGNCIAITSGESTILIDAGIAKTKIEKALLAVDIKPSSIEAIFITHAHGDHVKGISLANKYSIPVYAGDGEWDSIKGLEDHLINRLTSNGVLFDYDGFQPWIEVLPFKTHHDSRDPVGYVIRTDEYKISICLDTGHVDEVMLDAMRNSNAYVIESNHDRNMVEASSYPNSVKARILSGIGHLSNKQTADVLGGLIQGKGETIYLTHLSDKNNMPMLAKLTTVKELRSKGFEIDKDYFLEVK